MNLLSHQRHLVAEQCIDHFPLWPDRPSQAQQIALGLVDGGDRACVRLGHDTVFQGLQTLSELLQQREVAVNHRVEYGVCEIVGPFLANATGAPPDSLSHRVQAVARPLLKRQDEALPEEQTELLGFELIGQEAHACHDEQHTLILFDLGPLWNTGHVFQGQGVQAEDLTQRLDRSGVPKPVYVDPGHREGSRETPHLLHIFQRLPVEAVRPVGQDGQLRRRRFRIDVEGARHIAGALSGSPSYMPA